MLPSIAEGGNEAEGGTTEGELGGGVRKQQPPQNSYGLDNWLYKYRAIVPNTCGRLSTRPIE